MTQWIPKVGDEGMTRGGCPYHIVSVTSRRAGRPIIAEVSGPSSGWIVDHYLSGGKCWSEGDSLADLMPPTRKVTTRRAWVLFDKAGKPWSVFTHNPDKWRRDGYAVVEIPPQEVEVPE